MATTKGAMRITMKLAQPMNPADMADVMKAAGNLEKLKATAAELGFVFDGDVTAKADRFAFPDLEQEAE